MSLNYEFGKNFDKLTDEDKKMNDLFIWGSMIVDLGEITEKNAEEWYWRYCFADKLNGPYFHKLDEPLRPTLEDVKKRIGLHTNVGNKTRNQFIKKVTKIFKAN